MSIRLMRPLNDRQGDVLKGFQETLGRRTCRFALRIPCIQPGQLGSLDGESTAPDKFRPVQVATKMNEYVLDI